MKFEMFHLMPYRDLPDDFNERYHSVWVDVPSHLFDAAKAHRMFNETLDELELGAVAGYDGICVNEHHNNAYGMMPSPNLMLASLARRTKDVALIVLGNSIALYNPPVRVAEEIAMLDCITDGRIVSGFPVGTSMDTAFCYGINPATLRERYFEAEELIVRAWTDPDVFSFNGKFNQIRYVNIWPRPVQKPHPPIWIPGGGSIETWEWTLRKGYLYAYLSYSGFKRGALVMGGFWKKAEELGMEANPYHAGFLQLVCVGESQAEVEDRYAAHGEYFYNKMLHTYPGFGDAPGYRTAATIKAGLLGQTGKFGDRPKTLRWKDLLEQGNIVAGTPSQVTEQLEQVIKQLRVGHLMVLSQFGSMPHDSVTQNIKLTAARVLPKLRHLWAEWEDKWWPQNARRPTPAASLA